MTKKEIFMYLSALFVFLAIAVGIRYAQAVLFYGGDLRCLVAECRINK